MDHQSEIEQKVAEYLLQIKAIKLEPSKPFVWASGWKAPIYCDNRITLSHPVIRTYIRQKLAEKIQDEYGAVGMIAGVATAGIPQGVLVAQEMGLPFVYVRPEAKEHGRQNQIEGDLIEGQRIVVIEDLISTGSSSLKAVKALRDAGCDVVGLVAIFSYDFDIAAENFKEAKCRFSTLTNYTALLKYAAENKDLSREDEDLLREWRRDPANWDVK